MTAALLSRPNSKRKSKVTSDATFLSVESALYRSDASTDFARLQIGSLNNEKLAKGIVARLRAAEFARAALRSYDSFMSSQHEGPHSPKLTAHEAANWRRVRAALDQFKRIDAP